MRVGQGYDVHKLVTGRELVIGGVSIPHSQGLEAHSDGDVLIHALCDALLGAAGLGDIGQHFPDNDDVNKNRDSREFLRLVTALVQKQGMKPKNVDCTIIAQAPKMAPHIGSMRIHLAKDMGISLDCVNIKATTTEQLGFCGREEGIAAMAITLID